MNTENRVLAMLNKIGNVRTAKKENLGAIEDAINQVKQNIDKVGVDLVNFTDQLNEAINDSLLKQRALAESLLTDLQSISIQREEVFNQFEEINSELMDLGIDNGIDINKIDADFEIAYATADELINNLGL